MAACGAAIPNPLAYDEHLGYPIALGVDPALAARDDEIRVAVAQLVPGR